MDLRLAKSTPAAVTTKTNSVYTGAGMREYYDSLTSVWDLYGVDYSKIYKSSFSWGEPAKPEPTSNELGETAP